MSISTRVAAIGLAALFSVSAISTAAQVVPRTYQKGPVVQVTQWQVAPGKLNAFMQDYTTNQTAALEIGKKAGLILSYGAATVIARRDGEPNVITRITFKDLAALDGSYEAGDKRAISVYGSLDKAAQAAAKRGEYATQVGTILYQTLDPLK
jgi:hypothetical protein